MGSMHVGLEDRPKHLPRLAEFYAERARGGAALIVTGGFAPNRTGWLLPLAGKMTTRGEAGRHRAITDAVHEAGGRIALQLLHAGRYSYHPFSASASKSKSPITPFSRADDVGPRGPQHGRRLRALRRTRAARPATTASRSWAPRAT